MKLQNNKQSGTSLTSGVLLDEMNYSFGIIQQLPTVMCYSKLESNTTCFIYW